MPIDLAALSEENFPPKFTITSARLGELGFRALYGIDYPDFMPRTATGSDDEFIRNLMLEMGWRMAGLERLTHRSDLTSADLEAFCQALVENEPAVFADNPRKNGEGWLTYVRRAGGEAVKARKGPFEKSAWLDIEDDRKRALEMAGFGSSASALLQNIDAAAHMRSILEEVRPVRIDLPPLPRSPLEDTNSILERVESEIGRMAQLSEASAELQTTLNAYARSAITEMKAASDQTERNAQRALWVGVAGAVTGVLGTLIAMGTWLWTADQQNRAEVIRKADAETVAAERRGDRALMQLQLKAMQRTAEALEKTRGAPKPQGVPKQ